MPMPISQYIQLFKLWVNYKCRRLEAWQLIRNTAVAVVAAYYIRRFVKQIWADPRGYLRETRTALFRFARKWVPGVEAKIQRDTAKNLGKLERMVVKDLGPDVPTFEELPAKGMKKNVLLALTNQWRQEEEKNWKKGQVSGGIYHGGDALRDVLCRVYSFFSLSNPLHADVFPYVRKMEAEVVRMSLGLFGGDRTCVGTTTSGGTESILMACKAFRDYAYDKRGVTEPNMVIPRTAHAAFDKAGNYFKIKVRHVDIDEKTFKVRPKDVARAIDSNTIMIVGSAPCFAQGVVDPIEELGQIALKNKIPLHVDCCLGGFLLPFWRHVAQQYGDNSLPKYDFTVPGVVSISADTHKYGYAPKGSSVVLYRNAEWRRYQYFSITTWNGGIYASPAIQGSRPGGLIAATWAAMLAQGHEGYLQCAEGIYGTTKAIIQGVNALGVSGGGGLGDKVGVPGTRPGIRVQGTPDLSVVAIEAEPGSGLNILQVGEAMSNRGWNLNTLQHPPAIHICVTYIHTGHHRRFLHDLEDAVFEVREHPERFRDGSAAIYGMAEGVPDGSLLEPFIHGFLDCLYKTQGDLKPAQEEAKEAASSGSEEAKTAE